MKNNKVDIEYTLKDLVTSFVLETDEIHIGCKGKITAIGEDDTVQLDSIEDIIVYVMNDHYWSGKWSCYLISRINLFQNAIFP